MNDRGGAFAVFGLALDGVVQYLSLSCKEFDTTSITDGSIFTELNSGIIKITTRYINPTLTDRNL